MKRTPAILAITSISRYGDVMLRRPMRLLGVSLCFIAAMSAPAMAIDDPIPGPITQGSIQIGIEQVASGLTSPLLAIDAGDGTDRLFVVDQIGDVRLIKSDVLQAQPFLDVSSRLVNVGTGFSERGLLGLAFHPDYASLGAPGFGKIYTYTSEPGDGGDFDDGVVSDHQSVIVEWQVDANNSDLVDVNSSRELVRIDQPQSNHNAGMIAFGPDKNLYVALGDGGGSDDEGSGHGPDGNGQNINSILGSILRIDPLGNNSTNGAYGVPGGNPFVDVAGIDEIFAYGVRNPYRFSFARDLQGEVTEQLIFGDVGQRSIEEVNVLNVAEETETNFGWRVKEGTFTFDPTGAGDINASSPGVPASMTDPVLQYDHDEGISVIGGFVYHGTAIPALRGMYVFGEFVEPGTSHGRLFYADLNDPSPEILEFPMLDGPLVTGGDFDLRIKGMGQDKDGEIYIAATPGGAVGGEDGVVLRLTNVPGELELGDMNGDGLRDTADASAFVLALIDPTLFGATYPSVDADLIGDIDGSGTLDTGDIGPFNALFAPASASAASVPEPSALLLALLALSGVAVRRRF